MGGHSGHPPSVPPLLELTADGLQRGLIITTNLCSPLAPEVEDTMVGKLRSAAELQRFLVNSDKTHIFLGRVLFYKTRVFGPMNKQRIQKLSIPNNLII